MCSFILEYKQMLLAIFIVTCLNRVYRLTEHKCDGNASLGMRLMIGLLCLSILKVCRNCIVFGCIPGTRSSGRLAVAGRRSNDL